MAKRSSLPSTKSGSSGEQFLLVQFRSAGVPLPLTQYRFCPTRKWAFDFAWPEQMLAVEVEGGIWVRGRHNRGSGFLADCEKYNEAAILGWRVLRFPTELVDQGTALTTVERVFASRGASS